MSVLQAVIYGLLQGITGFLPVSSYGHLLLVNQVSGSDAGKLTSAWVSYMYIGALVAILILFGKDLGKMILECLCMIWALTENVFRFFCRIFGMKVHRKRIINSEYRKFACMLLVSTIPTAVGGYFLLDVAYLLEDFPWICGGFMLCQAVILCIAAGAQTGNVHPKDATYKDSFRLGLVQAVSCLPGFSRTGSTVTAALLYGFDKSFAMRYSMIMSIPAIAGVAYVNRGDMIALAKNSANLTGIIISVLLCAVSALISVRILNQVIKKQRFLPWAVYSALLGIGMIVITNM